MQFSLKDAERVLDKLQIDEVSCMHCRAGFFIVDGVRVLKLHYSRDSRTMSPTVTHLFRRSLKLSIDEFKNLVGCNTNREGYIEILRDRGHIRDIVRS